MQPTSEAPSSRRPFLRGLLAGGLFGGLFGGSLAAFAKDGSHGCRRWSRHHERDPEAVKSDAQRMVDRLLDRVQASEDQRVQIKALATRALDDLLPLRSRHHAHRNEILASLSQPAIDREALDRLRKAELALADSASSTLLDSLIAMAAVLTPDQRSQLSEMAQHWRGRRRG